MKLAHFGEAPEQGMDAFAQGAGALAVDHPDFEDALFEAFFEPGGQEFPEVLRAKSVEVEFPGDGDSVGFGVHGGSLWSKKCSSSEIFLF